MSVRIKWRETGFAVHTGIYDVCLTLIAALMAQFLDSNSIGSIVRFVKYFVGNALSSNVSRCKPFPPLTSRIDRRLVSLYLMTSPSFNIKELAELLIAYR